MDNDPNEYEYEVMRARMGTHQPKKDFNLSAAVNIISERLFPIFKAALDVQALARLRPLAANFADSIDEVFQVNLGFAWDWRTIQPDVNAKTVEEYEALRQIPHPNNPETMNTIIKYWVSEYNHQSTPYIIVKSISRNLDIKAAFDLQVIADIFGTRS
jgi:hypothetical protein